MSEMSKETKTTTRRTHIETDGGSDEPVTWPAAFRTVGIVASVLAFLAYMASH